MFGDLCFRLRRIVYLRRIAWLTYDYTQMRTCTDLQSSHAFNMCSLTFQPRGWRRALTAGAVSAQPCIASFASIAQGCRQCRSNRDASPGNLSLSLCIYMHMSWSVMCHVNVDAHGQQLRHANRCFPSVWIALSLLLSTHPGTAREAAALTVSSIQC